LVGLLLLRAAEVDAVAPPVDPWDDRPWVRLAPSALPLPEVEAVAGATREVALDRLGPPVRVRRDWRVPDGCAEVYVYPVIVESERAPAGLCISPGGRVDGVVDADHGSGGMSFDLATMSGEPTDMLGGQAIAVLLAVPVAVVIRARRRYHPLRFIGIRDRRT